MLAGGIVIDPDSSDNIAEYLNSQTPYKRLRSTNHTEWHGNEFVLPNQVFSTDEASEYYYSSPKRDHLYDTKGTLDGWRKEIGARAIGNSRLVFAICIALAGPALKLIEAESGGVNLYGTSSIGKTTTAAVAGSVWGGGGINGFVNTWRTTANGLELLAAEHNDTCLILDELGQLDPKSAAEVPYLLASGQSKTRMMPNGTPAQGAQWRLPFLSTGERPFDQVVKKGGDKTRGGMEVRLVNIPADAGMGLGVFETLSDCSSAKEFATNLSMETRQHYGVLGRSSLQHLVENPSLAQEYLTTSIRQFEKDTQRPQ